MLKDLTPTQRKTIENIFRDLKCGKDKKGYWGDMITLTYISLKTKIRSYDKLERAIKSIIRELREDGLYFAKDRESYSRLVEPRAVQSKHEKE